MQHVSWSVLIVDPLPTPQQSQPQYVEDGAPIEEVGPFSEDEEIHLNNDNKDDVDEDDNQNLNSEPLLDIEFAYSTPNTCMTQATTNLRKITNLAT